MNLSKKKKVAQNSLYINISSLKANNLNAWDNGQFHFLLLYVSRPIMLREAGICQRAFGESLPPHPQSGCNIVRSLEPD